MNVNNFNQESTPSIVNSQTKITVPAESKQSSKLLLLFIIILILSMVGTMVYILSTRSKQQLSQSQLKFIAAPSPYNKHLVFPIVNQTRSSPVSVLFIGNSFTSVNNLPETVSEIATSLGNNVIYDSSAPGGYTLQQHAQNQETIAKIKSKSWDFVVIQEQSEMPALSSSSINAFVIPYALKLSNLIRETSPKAQIVFFETWGYENGDTPNCSSNPNVCNYSVMQASLSKSYNLMAQKASGIVAPVGETWSRVRQNHPEIKLYQDDGRHPSIEGTYLTACVFYETLFKKNVVGASPINISSSEAEILQQTAQETGR